VAYNTASLRLVTDDRNKTEHSCYSMCSKIVYVDSFYNKQIKNCHAGSTAIFTPLRHFPDFFTELLWLFLPPWLFLLSARQHVKWRGKGRNF